MGTSLSKEDIAVQSIIEALHNFVNQTMLIAEKLLDIKTHYPHRMPEIRQALGGQLSPALESNLLSFAQGNILPEMVTDTSALSKTMAQLDIKQQEEYYKDRKKLEVYDINLSAASGNLTIDKLDVFSMDREQREMVFDGNKIRNLKEQSKWIHQHKVKTNKKKAKKDDYYLIHEDKIVIYKSCTLTLPNLYWIIGEIEKRQGIEIIEQA